MHTKLIIIGLVLLAAVICGFVFWGDLVSNQQDLSNTGQPVPVNNTQTNSSADSSSSSTPEVTPTPLSSSDDVDSIQADLNNSDPNTIDSDNSQVQTELSGL